jgi:transposase
MRYELSDYEWSVIKPMLPNKPRGVPRVDDRRVLNGIFWVLRSGAPWRDLPENYGPHTTCYNRFVRWRQAGIWDRIMNGLAAAHDAAVQMFDTSKVHVVGDANGRPVRLGLTPGEAHAIGSVRCF